MHHIILIPCILFRPYQYNNPHLEGIMFKNIRFLHSNVIKFCPKLEDILEFNKTLCDIDVFEKGNLYNQRVSHY